MRPRPNIAIVCALGLLALFALPSQALACSVCVAAGRDVHYLPALPGDPILPPIPQDNPVPPTFPLNVPVLSSRPGASAKIYLDFDGDFTPSWGTYIPGTTPAYSTDSDTTTYTQQELDNIHEIWLRIAEAYSPFNIDVTTVDPVILPDRVAVRVVIGGDGLIAPDTYWPGARAGGIGYVGGFSNIHPNTVFVFPGNLANGTPKYTAMAAAHEAGHSFGLQHQSEYSGFLKVQEYSDNDPTTTGDGRGHYSAQPKAPFMGVAYFADRGVWFYGPTTSAFAFQNDVDVIASANNAFGYFADEAPGEAEGAIPLLRTGASLLASGVITSIDDHDFYSFSVDEDIYTAFTLSGAPFGGMLDASLALYNSSGGLVKMVATPSLGEFLDAVLSPGTYALDVFSAGSVGDIGQYTLSGVVGVPETGISSVLFLLLPLIRRRLRQARSGTLRPRK